MHLPAGLVVPHPNPSRRETGEDSERNSRVTFLSVSAGLLLFLVCMLAFYIFVSRRVGKRSLSRSLSPSKYSWQFWNVRNKSYGQLSTRDRPHSSSGANPADRPTTSIDRSSPQDDQAAHSAVEAGVDRNTSVRSVMTLPAYSPAPQESERVIGREGERAGMDTVLEFPETHEEEEARRDDEMESLYQIRLARRREAAEREQRRRERREARETGDWERLEELRVQSRLRADSSNAASNTNQTAAALLAEHQSRGRDRRVSSVSYADVGYVRHDGSRARANSDESERGGLLEGAVPMGEGQVRDRASGSSSFFSLLPHPHQRNRSASSLSISTAASEVDGATFDQRTPPFARESRRTSGGQRSPYRSELAGTGTATTSSPATTRFTPEASSGSDDIGDSHIPPPVGPGFHPEIQPPTYDADWAEAPAYQSPVDPRNISPISPRFDTEPLELHSDSIPGARDEEMTTIQISDEAPRLPLINTLPSINVESATEPNTPSSPVRRAAGGGSTGP